MAGYSCQEEYDHYMSCQAEAEAQAEGEFYAAITDAMKFLADNSINPEEYKSFYENEKLKRNEDVGL